MLASKLLSTVGSSEEPLYSDSVFSAYLYTGNGSTQTINNGIDLAGKGGLVWTKERGGTYNHYLISPDVGLDGQLYSNTTNAKVVGAFPNIDSFNSNGYSLPPYALNSTSQVYVSWTFRKAERFFDCGTYTGNGALSRSISHSLSLRPGIVIIKCTSTASDWKVTHIQGTGIVTVRTLRLNTTDADGSGNWTGGSAESADASTFTITDRGTGSVSAVNASGQSYVWYAFAHDSTADGIIQCGSFTTDGSGNATVNLGWEPQYGIFKVTNTTGSWWTQDAMRGFGAGPSGSKALYPNTSDAEADFNAIKVNATGFTASGFAASNTYIYLAIRRPNKPPTTGTQVYNAIARTGTSADVTVNSTITPDLVISNDRTDGGANIFIDRLRGNDRYIRSHLTDAEVNAANTRLISGATQTGWKLIGTASNLSPRQYIDWFFKRAPQVFDQVCYTGTGSATTVAHSLGVAPELMIVKSRSVSRNWPVYSSAFPIGETIYLNGDNLKFLSVAMFNNTQPTSSVFSLGSSTITNNISETYIAYLFATKAGISSCFSYTGNGTSQNINCGFTTGSRFILLKRVDAAGDWYVWDSVRGITAGNDPHLSLNTTAAEVTSDDTVDPLSQGFTINQVAATNMNVNAASYIGLSFA